jgi:hypothetical protein
VLERGARERQVYLPAGSWISWHDDSRWVGPRRVRVPAPLERLPLFVRAGSVVPTRSPVAHVGETPQEPLVLEIFPGGDGDALLVEDDGESTAFLRGEIARTPIRLRDRAAGRLRLEIGRREGGYTIERRPARAVFRGAPPPRGVYLDALPLAAGPGLPGFRAAEGRVEVRFEDDGHARSVELEPAP